MNCGAADNSAIVIREVVLIGGAQVDLLLPDNARRIVVASPTTVSPAIGAIARDLPFLATLHDAIAKFGISNFGKCPLAGIVHFAAPLL